MLFAVSFIYLFIFPIVNVVSSEWIDPICLAFVFLIKLAVVHINWHIIKMRDKKIVLNSFQVFKSFLLCMQQRNALSYTHHLHNVKNNAAHIHTALFDIMYILYRDMGVSFFVCLSFCACSLAITHTVALFRSVVRAVSVALFLSSKII